MYFNVVIVKCQNYEKFFHPLMTVYCPFYFCYRGPTGIFCNYGSDFFYFYIGVGGEINGEEVSSQQDGLGSIGVTQQSDMPGIISDDSTIQVNSSSPSNSYLTPNNIIQPNNPTNNNNPVPKKPMKTLPLLSLPLSPHPPNLHEQIQLSNRTEWHNLHQLRNSLTPQMIPPPIYKNVCQILGAAPVVRKKKKKVKNVALLYMDPKSTKVNVWNFVVIFVVYFLELQISLTLGFGPTFWGNQIGKAVYRFGYICLILMLVADMVVNFNKGYYAFGQGRVIDDRTQITLKYLKSHFAPDLLSIGLLLIPLFQNNYFLNYLQILTMVLLFIKKFKCQAQITQSLEYRRTLRIVFVLGMLGCDVMLLGNFGACIFLGVDLLLWRLQFFGNDPQYYWLSNDSSYSVDLMNGPWIAQYVLAQSFSTGTLSTLAPGPFGKNPIEITYQLFVMIFFMILASYVAQVLISILYGNWQIRIFHENNIQKFDAFMSLKNVTMNIKTRIHNFFQLIWQFEIKNDAEGQQNLIDKLPLSLKEDLVAQLGFSSQLKFVDFFQNSDDLQKTVAFKIRSHIVDPDANLFEIGSPLDAVGQGHILFIKNGLAQFYFPFNNQKTIVCLSNTQKLMGQYQFITGLSYAFNCKSIDLSVIQKIHYSDFLSILRNFNLIQQFFVLRCKLMLYNQLNLISKTCFICDKYHRENQCTEMFIMEDVKQEVKDLGDVYEGLGFRCRRGTKGRGLRVSRKVVGVGYGNGEVEGKLGRIEEVFRKYEEVRRNITDLNQISDEVASFSAYYADFNLFT